MPKNKRKTSPINTSHFTLALCGNPNCGKTTLFNALTGSNQKVGNWPGVTVEQKIGFLTKFPDVAVVDTPGIYSLTPFTPDEQVASEYLSSGQPDIIINVVDVTNLERSLFLTDQLLGLGTPIVVALNMMDEAKKKGITTDTAPLKSIFNCNFFEISAAKNLGIEQLMNYCLTLKNTPAAKANASLPQTAQQRYSKIEKAVKQSQRTAPVKNTKATAITQRIDKIVLDKWLAFPIFTVILGLIFFLSVGLGGFLTRLINEGFTPWLQNSLRALLQESCETWLTSLIVDGALGGVMSVVGFLPQIVLLFGFIAALEASGYMSRIAFITDRLLREIGLGGRSFVSIVLGCGCSVPAIMATRTIKNTEERNTTVTLTPFMPCSAKLALITFFTSYIFDGNALVSVSFYLVCILVIILGGLLLKAVRRKHSDYGDTFLMELPTYRLPKFSNVVKQMWERGKAFLMKAGTVIFAASVILWVLQSFNFKFEFTDTEHSILASMGKLIAPVFVPLGFNDKGYGWQFAISTVSGIAAKETVVSTLEILLHNNVQNCISPLGAYSFVVYNLLTVPCIASVSASFSEQGSWKRGLLSVVFQVLIAYTISLVIYQAGRFAQEHPKVLGTILVCTTVLIALIWAASNWRRCSEKCSDCPSRHACKKTKQ